MSRKLISFDWAIKRLLRSKANFGILEGFLSELLFEDIKIEEILESESNKETKDDKYNRVDIKVKNSKDEIILVEIQYGRELDYMQRMVYGTSKVITEHMDEGDAYSKVVKVISINIIYFDFGDGDDYIYKGKTVFRGLHNNSILELDAKQKKLYNKERVDDVYPEYYVIKVNNFDENAKDTLDEWIYFLKTEKIESDFKAKGLSEAKKKLDYMKFDEDEKARYEKFKEYLHDQASAWESTYVIGKIEGKIEGKMEGKIEGENEKAIEVAIKSLAKGIDIETIVAITGLSVEEIMKLKKYSKP
ncbi:MAG TPA: Rpn family recombination-promoting nuclease/putative transposase [Campylobacterales bacterium]|nr:Rpn family recombination-promoting nuclease/putative transposase [Campylobacterales bacterium]